ncbi:antitoxin [Roseateles sp. UC29_93]|uniref:antitoxin n=1 Tax=Roseateles sp. UC29_93 TaxID=3350177 RepID=UPI00366ED594
MNKPQTADAYAADLTLDCERLLVTLMRGLGPWADSVVLVGGLTPRYLVKRNPPEVPEHAGTQDVDVVVETALLATVDAYRSLEDNLKKLGFERGLNERQQRINWRWEVRTGRTLLRLEFLADMPGQKRVEALPTEGNISALNVPHSSIVFDHFETATITAETLGGNGIVTQRFKHADLVAFTTLKAFAFHQRWERKDAHDLVFCLEHARPLQVAADAFMRALAGRHAAAIEEALQLLARHFADDLGVEGYLKDGPVGAARFELGDGPDDEEIRLLRQREASHIVSELLKAIATRRAGGSGSDSSN